MPTRTALMAALMIGAIMTVGHAKNSATFYTPERIAIARENVERYDWAQAVVVIPAAQWAEFRHGLVKAYNAHQERCYQAALALWRRARKEKLERSDRSAVDGILNAVCSGLPDSRHRIEDAVFRRAHGRPLKPRKKDFPKLPVTTTTCLGVGVGAQIAFQVEKREVHWTVAENNRAVESAWEHPVGRAFARALQHVRWTRESGGHFFGNDEVNRDASYVRGGANYITRTYGPLGKQARACSRLCTGRDLMR